MDDAVGEQRDIDNVLYTRKAMIRCNMSLDLNGVWEEMPLSPELQNIVNRYRENFNGEPVHTERDLEGEAIESDNNSWYIRLISVVNRRQ